MGRASTESTKSHQFGVKGGGCLKLSGKMTRQRGQSSILDFPYKTGKSRGDGSPSGREPIEGAIS